ncbi:MAG: ATP-binding protein [Planctomycetota bacterium]|nr:ATP-binding protein [Planctomycetota bacterium]MDA1142867.1 ATP-binding protein [Planctomycetota bacterium]
MIKRVSEELLERLKRNFPVIAVTGPRQSGKTTLCRSFFKDKAYVSFENPDVLERVTDDPRGFLASHAEGAILDEVQRRPQILSYLQQIVDEDPTPGRFVLTGSQQFGLMSGITQTLAGRVGTLELLPFSHAELNENREPGDLDSVMFQGLYPPIHDRGLEPSLWYANYTRTYVERDVRQLTNVRDLAVFQRFVRLCAGRIGQLVNYSDLASDCGITYNTAKSWLSVLQASYLLFLLQPHHKSFNKRIIKTPKLYFYDTGLACWLLNVQSSGQLNTHAIRGHLFESWAISELVKKRFNQGLPTNLYFWQDRARNEVDVIYEDGNRLYPIEIKSGSTFRGDFLKGLHRWTKLAGESSGPPCLIYGGDESFIQKGTRVMPWYEVEGALEPKPGSEEQE